MITEINSVEDLRKAGYKVYVSHFRRYLTGKQRRINLQEFLHEEEKALSNLENWLNPSYIGIRFPTLPNPDNIFINEVEFLVARDARNRGYHSSSNKLLPRGGITEIEVYDKDDNYVAYGEAKCSEKDVFNRKTALNIALGRVIKSLETGSEL